MHIIHIASEMSPIAKVGGLADVVHGLAKEEQALGHTVEILLPKYDILRYSHIQNLKIETPDLWSFEDGKQYHNSVWAGTTDGLRTLLIDPHHNDYYFNRGQIYGSPNDVDRFLYFCRASLEYLLVKKIKPDILHLHDWPTATCATLVKNLYEDLGFSPKGIVLTIHSIEHQGKCLPKNLTRIGLRGENFRTEEKLQDEENPILLNLLKGGIIYSDQVTTVSPTYAEEVLTPEYGYSLNETLIKYKHKFTGILNGLDLESWNPSSDPYLAATYPSNPTFLSKVLAGKKANKEALKQKTNLAISPDDPLIGVVSRLALQKGPHLIRAAMHHLSTRKGSFIYLGSAQDKALEMEFLSLKEHYKKNPRIQIYLEFNEELSHLIYAASDAFLIPSLFEPCGLTQMIAMRYGTLPIARKTGGLADTVFNRVNGFTFTGATETSLIETLDQAVDLYQNNQEAWCRLIEEGLTRDFSWKASTLRYLKIYGLAMNSHGAIQACRM